MERVISKESVRRGNAAMIHGVHRGVSLDSKNVSVRCRTVSGMCTMTFSRKDIVREANKAFGKIMK
ncbi:hypothetical protein ABHZ32_12000 [Bacteroides uniformis]|uniref:hypothetical protein n=1 Tax=Bacteroides uniformis TaxID=820 RepID=UPI00321C2474